MSRYYVYGCKINGCDTERCEDSEAQFWTLYSREPHGESQGIIDCVFREDAEAAMAVYAERDRLNKQLLALAAESALALGFKRFCLSFISKLGTSEASTYVKEKLVTAANKTEQISTDKVLLEVGARAVEGFAADLYKVANEHVENGRSKKDVIQCRAAAKSAEDYAARIRAGEVQP